jgi:hypothetical protein
MLVSYEISYYNYSRVWFCDGSFYDDSLLRPLPSRTEHFRLVLHYCSKWSVLSVFTAFLALFRYACVSSFSVLLHFFKTDCDFSNHDFHQKDRLSSLAKKEWKEQKRLTLETKILMIIKMEASDKRKLKLNVVIKINIVNYEIIWLICFSDQHISV